jgi:hypothetical protein
VQKGRHSDSTTKEYYITVALTSGGSDDPESTLILDGAVSGTCTRCLRYSNTDTNIQIGETFLLEVPHGVSTALAQDTNSELRRRRLRASSSGAHTLTNGMTVVLRMHNQKACGSEESLLAVGTLFLEPTWLRSSAMQALKRSLALEDRGAEGFNEVSLVSCSPMDFRRAQQGPRRAIIDLSVELQRVSQWTDDTPDAIELRMSKSQRGNRSLRVSGWDMRWHPIVRGGMQQAATSAGALSGSIMGLDMHTGVVLEESFAAGVRRETIRSTVRVLNNLDFALQV